MWVFKHMEAEGEKITVFVTLEKEPQKIVQVNSIFCAQQRKRSCSRKSKDNPCCLGDIPCQHHCPNRDKLARSSELLGGQYDG
jgi:hypothetical protein